MDAMDVTGPRNAVLLPASSIIFPTFLSSCTEGAGNQKALRFRCLHLAFICCTIFSVSQHRHVICRTGARNGPVAEFGLDARAYIVTPARE
jgi:hypothetical protein